MTTARNTQLGVEYLDGAVAGEARSSQFGVEYLQPPSGPARLSQFGVEFLYQAGPEAPGTISKEQAFRALPRDLLVVWHDFFGKDVDGNARTYRWSPLELSNPSLYLEPRVLTMGPVERKLSDRNGRLEASMHTFELADPDNAIRGFLANVHQRPIRNTEIVTRVQRYEDFLAELEPLVAFRGRVKIPRPRPGRRFSITCQDWFTSLIDQDLQLPKIGPAFPGAPAAARELDGPLWYGRQSDEGSADAAPVYDANAARGFAFNGTEWIAGYGDLPGDPPSGVGLVENAGAGSLPSGLTARVFVTAIHAGVESNPDTFLPENATSITTTGANAAFTASWTPAAGTPSAYRAYFLVEYFGWRALYYMETAGTSVQFTAAPDFPAVLPDASNITPGGTLITFGEIFDYALARRRTDGVTVLSAIARGISTPFRRPLYLRWLGDAGDEEYFVFRKSITGDWDRRWTVAAGVLEFTDSILDDDPTLAYVNGSGSPRGVVPCLHVGTRPDDVDGHPWQAFVIASHAIAAVRELYTREGDAVTIVTADRYGVDTLAPGKPNFSSFFNNVYYDAPNGTRWALVYMRGPFAEAIVAGTMTLWANIDGVEPIGDGSGAVLEALVDQIAHFWDNFVLPETPYAGGLWGATPTWQDGTVKRDLLSFAAAKSAMQSALHSTAGAWGVTTTRRTLDINAELMVSGDLAYGTTREGQARIVLEDPVTSPEVVETLTETNEIADDEFDWWEDEDPNWHYNRERADFAPDYAPGGGVTYREQLTLDDDDSQERYRQVITRPDTVRLAACRQQSTALTILRRRLDRAKDPPRHARVPTGLHAFLHELGDVIAVDHTEGAAPLPGWIGEQFMLRGIAGAFDVGKTYLTTRAIVQATRAAWEIEELGMEYPLGGSLVQSPTLTASSPQTVQAYDPPGAHVEIPWSLLPTDAVVTFRGKAQVETGVTSIEVILWDETAGAQAGTSGVITATTLTDFSVVIARPGDLNKEYSMRASVVGGAVDKSVHFKGKVRVSI